MVWRWQSVCILPMLFAAGYGQLFGQRMFENPNAIFDKFKILGVHELFGNPFGNPHDYKIKKLPNNFGTSPIFDDGPENGVPVQQSSKNVQVDWAHLKGSWELVSNNSGVSAMHSILLPKINKVLMYDATIWRASNIDLPRGQCRVLNETTGEQDCKAHSVLFDINTFQISPLLLRTDTWCSSGGLTVDGVFISTGGFQSGANTVRYLPLCEGCGWKEYPNALAARRWYATQAQLPDGGFIVVGGRDSFSHEYIPREGQSNTVPFIFNLLKQTNDKDENNLYPFVHLSTDGNVFIFANSRSLLLDPKTNTVIRELPELPGGHRNYPASGMSALLPIRLFADEDPKRVIPAEVLVCGGSTHVDSYSKAHDGEFYTALMDCGRMRITDPKPVWKLEMMPSPRIMGDMMVLPNGDVLMLNGAKRGASGWGFARDPNLTPVLYTPGARNGERMRELTPAKIPRMYHSSSVVLPDGRVLVAGSNTNNGYRYDAMFPTELRVERFSPPYLDPSVAGLRPTIMGAETSTEIRYGSRFVVMIKRDEQAAKKEDLSVTLYAPAFTTHGVSMNQRLVILGVERVTDELHSHAISALAPPKREVAPPGYYLMSVVRSKVPSASVWVRLS